MVRIDHTIGIGAASIFLDVFKTRAAIVLTPISSLVARAATAETILSSYYPISVNQVIHELEVGGERLVVDLVDDGNWYRFMGSEGTQLAPVTCGLLTVVTLRGRLADRDRRRTF